MAYLIDTGSAIHARDGADAVLDKLAAHDGAVLLSALSLADFRDIPGLAIENGAVS